MIYFPLIGDVDAMDIIWVLTCSSVTSFPSTLWRFTYQKYNTIYFKVSLIRDIGGA